MKEQFLVSAEEAEMFVSQIGASGDLIPWVQNAIGRIFDLERQLQLMVSREEARTYREKSGYEALETSQAKDLLEANWTDADTGFEFLLPDPTNIIQ